MIVNTLKKMVLNRAVFSKRPYDSGALTVLGTLFHRFPEAGDYELFVSRDGETVHRTQVQVVAGNAPAQVNLDLASLGSLAEGCHCEADKPLVLLAGGVVSFYASQGVSAYSVEVSKSDDKNKRKVTLLDSSGFLPEGDLYGVTLVHAGAYRVTATAGKAKVEGEIRVGAPGGEKYRPDQPVLVQFGKEGFSPKSVQILAGQTVVFQLNQPARIQVQLVRPEGPSIKDKVRQKHTLNKVRPGADKPGTQSKERDKGGEKGKGRRSAK